MIRLSILPLVAGLPLMFAGIAAADTPHAASPEVAARLKALYPKTTFNSIKPAPIPGLSEVVMGENVAYVDASGRYFLFGHVYDMQEGVDLTARTQPAPASKRIDFASLPLADAIVSVQGSGKRKLAVFSDPDCPYCQRLAQALSKVKDVTIYTFLMPLDELHPEARKRSAAVWCAKDRSKAWLDLIERGVAPKDVKANESCDTPMDRNLALASRLGVTGTPALFSEDGRRLAGAASTVQLERFLDPTVKTSLTEAQP